MAAVSVLESLIDMKIVNGEIHSGFVVLGAYFTREGAIDSDSRYMITKSKLSMGHDAIMGAPCGVDYYAYKL